MADEKDPHEATTHADLYQREGEPDPEKWDEAEAVTGRPADVAPRNSTLASRAAANKAETKVVESAEAENKSVRKAPAKRKRT